MAPRRRPDTVGRVVAARLDFDLQLARYLGAAMLALGVVLPHLPGRPGLPCPLRSVTGVPCPFCGLTTSVEATLHGDGHAAWSANPFGLLLVGLAAVLVAAPKWRKLTVPTAVFVGAIAASWLFELLRYHII